ncbi:MAG TPA: M20/M25/M40 family metallo-hydrolase [Myxococcaceae bacterium]|jgi:acetylornithine deacetylase/succinyl-diaminopimelate desuccinylase-like protein
MPRLLALFPLVASLPSLAGSAASTSVPVPARVMEETRQVLDQLVSVDTSHGRETDALAPVAERLRGAGLSAQVMESGPGRGNLVVRLRGDGSKRPLLLLTNVDVVPVEGQPWTVPPFKVTEKDGWLYGRGVNDNKGHAAIFTALVLELARERTRLRRDVILALTADEETGSAAGAAWVVKNHPELVDADLVLTGGGDTRLARGGDKAELVGLGVAEKTFQDYRISVKGPGGHSSMPSPASDIVPRLARALVKVGEVRFAAHALAATRTQVELEAKGAAPAVGAAMRKLIAGKALTPAEDEVLASDPARNALLRTTCVTTMLHASPQDNVLPTSATATANCRVMPDETTAGVRERLAAAIGDPAVTVELLGDFSSAPAMELDGAFEKLYRDVAARHFPGAVVFPTLLAGASDARFFRLKGIRAYNVVDTPFTEEESSSNHVAHGPDERRPVRWLAPTVAFLRDLTRSLAM